MARTKRSHSGERLTVGLYVQLTPSQRQQIREDAAARGARLSDYVRERLFRRAGESIVVAGVRRNPDAKALADEIRRVGNNLNQLAHHANAQDLLAEVRDLRAVTALVKAALERVIAL
jgi:hypothetical protein